MSDHQPFSADGHRVAWSTWDRESSNAVEVRWDNEAWTVSGKVSSADVEYVMRFSPMWEPRQFLLFRDLAEPDLWLGTDGQGRWGEVNGAHRPDLDSCFDILLPVSAFAITAPIRRMPLSVGEGARLRALSVDVETLGVVPVDLTLDRVDVRRWRVESGDDTDEFEVDKYGVPLDIPGRFRRDEG